MEIKNFTPYTINIVENTVFSEKDKKHLSAKNTKVVSSLQPCGELLNATLNLEKSILIQGIPTRQMTFSSIIEAPKNYWCIVPVMYVVACHILGEDTSNLLTLGVPIYDSSSIKIIGYLNLIHY